MTNNIKFVKYPRIAPAKIDFPDRSERSGFVVFFLCLLLGTFGAHRFYSGHKKLGVLYLLTFGFAYFGPIIDLFKILFDRYRDDKGKIIYLDIV